MRGRLKREPRRGPALHEWERIAVDAVGEVIEFWGFKRNQGRVWALLYLRGHAATAIEIQQALGLSKGAVSIITRELEHWRVLERHRRPDSEVWHFVAAEDLMEMIARVLRERESGVLSRARSELAEAERAARLGAAESGVLRRIRRMHLVADLVERALAIFLKTARLDVTRAMGVLAREGRSWGRRRGTSPS